MKGRTYKRCPCPTTWRTDADGRRVKVSCRKDHGSWSFAHDGPERPDGKRRQIVRGGFRTQTEAQEALTQSMAAMARSEFVDTGKTVPTVTDYLDEWLRGKRKLRYSVRKNYKQHIDNHLTPLLGKHKLTDLRSGHIDRMLDALVAGDEETGRKPVSVATSRRVFATLRVALNAAVKRRPPLILFNPCASVELEAEEQQEQQVWSALQVRAFFEASAGDRLALLYRLILLRGLRRGEAVGLRWSDVDFAEGIMWIRQSVVQVGGEVRIEAPKTKSSAGCVSIDARTIAAFKAQKKAQNAERLAWAGAYDETGLVFAQEDGTVEHPERVSRRFKAIAKRAGLPPIRLHDGRHTAATLALEAGATMKEVQDLLRHSTYRITADTYSHVSQERRDRNAEQTSRLVDGPPAKEA